MAKHPFEQFNLESSLIDAVKDLNFEKPTEIQNRIIPRILKRTKILIGQSQTGTGKSHAIFITINAVN
ncbi:DEAD-box ATP-dependent RNA helicase CshB domain protein [Staphylococcus aureus subsp. aureus 21318]|nr:DEAD-box ATP-dependent RNA helicase CshB domain protein [Staphylococcus aureus subsp. aureus 21318]